MPVSYYVKTGTVLIIYYKPVSRILYFAMLVMTIKGRGYHLSVLNITVGINLPTHQHRTSRPYPAWRER